MDYRYKEVSHATGQRKTGKIVALGLSACQSIKAGCYKGMDDRFRGINDPLYYSLFRLHPHIKMVA
jgi:hypothetical protein